MSMRTRTTFPLSTAVIVWDRVRVLLTCCPCAPYIHSRNMQMPCRKKVDPNYYTCSICCGLSCSGTANHRPVILLRHSWWVIQVGQVAGGPWRRPVYNESAAAALYIVSKFGVEYWRSVKTRLSKIDESFITQPCIARLCWNLVLWCVIVPQSWFRD